jgi:hypothetical protein
MAALANKVDEGQTLTEEEQLEVLMIQVTHHLFSQIEDEEIEEATTP